jgi:hypothetical protein
MGQYSFKRHIKPSFCYPNAVIINCYLELQNERLIYLTEDEVLLLATLRGENGKQARDCLIESCERLGMDMSKHKMI